MTRPLQPGGVLRTWWPLAASWLMMGVEIPIVAAMMSRLADAEVMLAAFGGVVFPFALVIEAPVIMMLAASTALCTDPDSFRRLRRFMVRIAATLTVLQMLIVVTPVFDVLALRVIGVPPEVVPPARLGLTLMIPWTWAIADRRFNQGVLIRLGHQRQVGIGTMIRLVASFGVVGLGLATEALPGIAVAGLALTTGVLVEAAYARWCLRRTGLGVIADAAPPDPPLTARRLWRFYLPLAMTPLIVLLAHPIGSAGISRMPGALGSLAVWPVLDGLAFLLCSVGVAYNEVTIRHCGDLGGVTVLRRIAWIFGITCSLLLVLVAATPVAAWWFTDLSRLPAPLARIAHDALWWATPLPLLSFLHSYYQGVLVHTRRARGIPEAVAVFLIVCTAVLVIGVVSGRWPGARVAMAAMTAGAVAQAIWLSCRCRGLLEPLPAAAAEARPGGTLASAGRAGTT